MQIRAPLPDLAKKQPASFLPHIFVLIHVSVRNTERMQNYVFREGLDSKYKKEKLTTSEDEIGMMNEFAEIQDALF